MSTTSRYGGNRRDPPASSPLSIVLCRARIILSLGGTLDHLVRYCPRTPLSHHCGVARLAAIKLTLTNLDYPSLIDQPEEQIQQRTLFSASGTSVRTLYGRFVNSLVNLNMSIRSCSIDSIQTLAPRWRTRGWLVDKKKNPLQATFRSHSFVISSQPKYCGIAYPRPNFSSPNRHHELQTGIVSSSIGWLKLCLDQVSFLSPLF